MDEQQKVSADVEKAFEQGVGMIQPAEGQPAPGAQDGNAGAGVSGEELDTIVEQALDSEAPEAARSVGVRNAVEQFNALEVDDKLAVLYYLYEAMGESVTPAAPGAADIELTTAFFGEFNALTDGDTQLEAMRALVRCEDNTLGREYGKLSENNKLVIWYLLAERMGDDVIGMPDDYQLGDLGQQNLVHVKELDFEQQITFLRDVVNPMGHDPIERAV
ncbi:orange carotenoid protein N-terminal domain-containing protein [Gloeobacter violaceus]|uniref:Gll0260 protein n=1 Tax=Gloeobacter violaceus (strain ATCC 29082 / PCC 7421) TaxID=251221 RepID=Q7NNZ8_GLOVI|nr:orange carotenoid protein N-terminal domain-containing protein [Gloeobacter violaceus]BAC88201.1 gll0260 [Gloeobacter violaceus PCC 7421]